MTRRISLREFQESLSRRFVEAGTGDHRTLLAVEAGESRWVLPLAQAGEIMPVPPLTSVPLTQPWFRGVANVRGTLFGVVDWARFSGEAPTRATPATRLLLIGMRHGINCAILVSNTVGLRNPSDFGAEPVLPADAARPWIGPALGDGQGVQWRQLEVPALIADMRFLDVGIH